MTPEPSPPAPRRAADDARLAEETLRERWNTTQDALRERFDAPISRATELTRLAVASFPVRVWRRFLQRNGFLLAAGVSYQSLFAIFGAIYVVFAIVGLWLGGSPAAVNRLIELINSYIPNLIMEEGLIEPDAVRQVATDSASTLTITSIIALGIVIWAAIGFITFTRRAIRDIFGLPYDNRNYVLLKARDLLAAAAFGLALVAGAALGQVATWALRLVFELLQLPNESFWSHTLGRAAVLVVGWAVNSTALAALFRFLTGTQLGWRTVWPGSILGGGALVVLQVGAGLLLGYTPSNPLLATFAVLIGFLLWFRLAGIVILVAASWIAVSSADHGIPLLLPSESELLRAEHETLRIAAELRLRTAREAASTTPWYRSWGARRRVREAETELLEVEASAPLPPTKQAPRRPAR
ncbi:YihY/virulence factor BrkB family protein [Microbacterium sp.]|uniref:YihY/virulence factor BrkB family protein n=1 Tax=Microbacterium sp. TaxID=51671 RepID=UPI003C74D08F